ncbi:MAG: hypothetical protein U9Q38_07270, partial [Thermodesulfobacteriota bacterium]|nr:hypothetical protein [Thermodesulfobacteriota bacterium]
MKTLFNKIGRLTLFSLAMVIIIGISAQASAKESRIAVIPFKMNAEKDLTFLKEGIHSMLTSRLSWENRVFVIGPETFSSAFPVSSLPIT